MAKETLFKFLDNLYTTDKTVTEGNMPGYNVSEGKKSDDDKKDEDEDDDVEVKASEKDDDKEIEVEVEKDEDDKEVEVSVEVENEEDKKEKKSSSDKKPEVDVKETKDGKEVEVEVEKDEDDKEKDTEVKVKVEDEEDEEEKKKKEGKKISKEGLKTVEEKLESLTDTDLKKVIFKCLNIENNRKAKKEVGDMVEKKDEVKESYAPSKETLLLARMAELGGVIEEKTITEGIAERSVINAVDSLDNLKEVYHIIKDRESRKAVKRMAHKIKNILYGCLANKRNPGCSGKSMERY